MESLHMPQSSHHAPITSSTLPNLEAAGEKDPSELETLPVKSSLAALADFQWEGVSCGYKLRLPKKNSVPLLWARPRLPCDCTFFCASVCVCVSLCVCL